MMNDNNTKNFQPLEDGALEQATGGYLQVSQWRNYVSANIVPLLTAQLAVADNIDRAILNRVYSTFQGTMVPGASVVGAIQQMTSDYYMSRSNIHSDAVRQTLDSVVSMAGSYLAANA